jgi:ABC-type multidrug transport system ATPase subunit
LRFTSEEESLFLLDEPDTHLNPQWSVDYLRHLENFLSDEDGEQDSSHVILSTHNPLAVAELKKEQVQILKRDKDDLSITSHEPDTHPRGMGYAGVITSEMFGLDSALDSHTQKLLEEKRQLAAKDGPLTDEEKIQLGELNEKLEKYGFRYEIRDPVYTEFLKLRYNPDYQDASARQLVDMVSKSSDGEESEK